MAEHGAMTIIYEPGDDGWIVATIPEVAGVFSQGHTEEEARANVIEALQLMLAPEAGAETTKPSKAFQQIADDVTHRAVIGETGRRSGSKVSESANDRDLPGA